MAAGRAWMPILLATVKVLLTCCEEASADLEAEDIVLFLLR
jgi:hypothetical protein